MILNVRDIPYHVAVDGDPAREAAMVLLHGFSGSSQDWVPLTPRLRDAGRSVIAVDLMGHGKTGAPADPLRYTMAETVRDLDTILSDLGSERPDWLGYSMGGRVALHMALSHPERVRSLVLESTSLGIEDVHARARRRDADDAFADRIEERGIEWFVEYWSTLPLFETQGELPPATLAALRSRRMECLPAGLARSLRGMGQGAHDYLGSRLGSLRCDVLLIAGELDLKYVDMARRTAEAVPGSACMIVPGAGHTVHLEALEAFADAIAAHWITISEQNAEASSRSYE